MSQLDKPLPEGVALVAWISGIVVIVVFAFLLHKDHYDLNRRLDALGEACGVEQVEG